MFVIGSPATELRACKQTPLGANGPSLAPHGLSAAPPSTWRAPVLLAISRARHAREAASPSAYGSGTGCRAHPHVSPFRASGNNAGMLRLIGLVISIGLADSLNPTTIAPALFMALGENARGRVIRFTIGVFAVYLLGGLIIALGPGQLLLSLIPRPDGRTRWILEIVAGLAMLVGSAYLWRNRNRLSHRSLPEVDSKGKSSAILGATITAVELPTAFPYFAAIAAIVGSGFDPARQVILLLMFNICFIVPLLAIVATLTLAGDDAQRVLRLIRDRLQTNWPKLLAIVGVLAGVFVTVLGVTGLAGS